MQAARRTRSTAILTQSMLCCEGEVTVACKCMQVYTPLLLHQNENVSSRAEGAAVELWEFKNLM